MISFQGPAFDSSQLPGGGNLLVSRRCTPLLRLQLASPQGTHSDPWGKEGLANLAMSLLREQPAAATLSRSGAVVEAGCDRDFSFLAVEQLGGDLEQGGEGLRQLLETQASGMEELVARHKTALDARDSAPDPADLAEGIFLRELFGRQAAGRPALGTSVSRASITEDDIRAFHLRWHRRLDRALVVVGGLEDEALAENTSLATLLPGPDGPGARASNPTKLSTPALGSELGGGTRRWEEHPSAHQTELRVGHRGVALGHPDFGGLQLLAGVLGGGYNSRLGRRLRDSHGWVYSVSSRFEGWNDGGTFVVRASVASDRVDQALGVILEEMDRLRQELVSAAELRGVQNSLVGLAQISLCSSRAIAGFLQHLAMHGLLDVWQERYSQDLLEQDSDSLKGLAEKFFFPAEAIAVAVGPSNGLLSGWQTTSVLDQIEMRGQPTALQRS